MNHIALLERVVCYVYVDVINITSLSSNRSAQLCSITIVYMKICTYHGQFGSVALKISGRSDLLSL